MEKMWEDFKGKNSGNYREEFENLARLLFRERCEIKDSLPYNINNIGGEAEPFEYKGDMVVFQAKFFDDGKIDDKQIRKSLEKACKYHSNITKFIVYTNAAFGNPRKKGDVPKGKKNIEELAQKKNVKIEWMFGKDIMDLVLDNKNHNGLLYDRFFNPNSNLCNLEKDVNDNNKLKLESIFNCIPIGDKKIEIDHSEYIKSLSDIILEDGNIIISGESGSGKSAIVKSYCESILANDDYTFLILDASAFRATNINDTLNLPIRYNLGEFCMYFEGVTHKFMVIDSAEKLLSLEDDKNAKLFIGTLKDRGWSFVLTCRENSVNDLKNKLKKTNITYDIISVEPETIDSLNVLAKDYNIKLPTDPKLLKQLTYPFYLARYCELSNKGNLTLENFREEIWNSKVRGCDDGVNHASQIKREQCLLEIVEQMQIWGYIVPYDKTNIDSASALVSADIIGEVPHKGYFVMHDIYTDWAWYYIILRDFGPSPKYDVLFESNKTNIQYINAFMTWFSEKIEKGEKEVDEFSNKAFDDGVPSLWRKAIFECIGCSECYAQEWFKTNDKKLSENDYKIFNEFVDVLCVSCHKVEYVEFNGKTLSRSVPIGSGWNMAIDFIYKHASVYCKDNLGRVYKLLSRFFPSKNYSDEISHYAGKLSLRIFDNCAVSRKAGKFSFLNFKEREKWVTLVYKYSCFILEELKVIYEQVVKNHWMSDGDPYIELTTYILKTNSLCPCYDILFRKLRKEIIALMDLFWKEQTSNGNDIVNINQLSDDYSFGINHSFADYIYCSSAIQTPIYNLLVSEYKYNKSYETVDFLINFVDYCVTMYKERNHGLDNIYEIEVKLRNGTKNKIIMSQGLWCLYRGIYSPSPFMESIHMALERYLLLLAGDNSGKVWVNEVLWRIIENSHSCTLYSIAASIITAYPKDYYAQFLFMMQDIHFLLLDLNRLNDEQYSINIELCFFPQDKPFYNERHESNNLPHRKNQLYDLLIMDIKTARENGKSNKLKQLYAIIDNWKPQMINPLGYQKENIIEDVKDKDITSNLNTPIPSAQVTEQEQVEKMGIMYLKIISLQAWVNCRFKGNYADAGKYEYDNNIQKALELIREINKKIEIGDFPFPKECEFLPSMTSALLLLQYYAQLNEKEKQECIHIIIEALSAPKFILSSPFSSYEMCIEALPKIIELMPNEYNKLQEILLAYALRFENKNNSRSCDSVYRMVGEHNLWEKNRAFMDGAVEKFKQSIKMKDPQSITSSQAVSLLCLLSKNNPLRDCGKLCIEKISTLWAPNKNETNLHYISQFVERLVADYIIHAPKEEVKGLISFFKPYLKGLHPSFLDAFSTISAEQKLYDNFWLVWEELYNSVINEDQKNRDFLINSYLLNPKFKLTGFDIRKGDVEFFKRVANDMGEHPSVMCSIPIVFITIGKKYLEEMIPTIDKLCENLNLLDEDKKADVISHLECMMSELCGKNRDILKKNHELKKHIENILVSMRDNDSRIASDLLQQWV